MILIMSKPLKTFITAISFQREGMYDLVKYIPVECKELKYGRTRNPIIPVISHYAKGEESIRIIAILTDGPNFKHNYETYFIPELTKLCEKLGVNPVIEVITSPDDETIKTHEKLFIDLITRIGDNEELYACTTFGTKPTPIVIERALNYARKLKKNTRVKRVVYGRYHHNEKREGFLHDVTKLYILDSFINMFAENKSSDPEKAMRMLLGISDEEPGWKRLGGRVIWAVARRGSAMRK
jgi:hypothetical protein